MRLWDVVRRVALFVVACPDTVLSLALVPAAAATPPAPEHVLVGLGSGVVQCLRNRATGKVWAVPSLAVRE